GPAGLTTAYELLKRTSRVPVVLERSERLGGISCTVNYKGNLLDVGGHRFFSKSDRVMQWWLEMLPIERLASDQLSIAYQGKRHSMAVEKSEVDPERDDRVMLVRSRKSSIYFEHKLYDYPLAARSPGPGARGAGQRSRGPAGAAGRL
ncbi:MAG: FAD-dependent oxidoreductase, partial [Acidobacteriota bacterium]|nr:FAD-dependent oxidoreductase [Acidobacteriota bacterium]